MKAGHGKFFGIEEVKQKMLESGRELFSDQKKNGGRMNIWLEYFKFKDTNRNNSHAQFKEQAKWVEPDPKKV